MMSRRYNFRTIDDFIDVNRNPIIPKPMPTPDPIPVPKPGPKLISIKTKTKMKEDL